MNHPLTVNGVTQVIVSYSAWSGQQPTSPPQYGPWFWLKGNSSVVASLPGIPTGATIVVSYTPFTQSVAASVGNGCGSGVDEAVAQVQNVGDLFDSVHPRRAKLAHVSKC